MSDESGMLAVRVRGPGDLRVERIPVPTVEAGSGAVLLRVRSAGVCATDRKIVARGAGSGEPLVLGHEIVAEVVADSSPPRRVVVAPNVGCGTCWQCRRGSPNYCLENQAFGIHVDGGMAEYLLVPSRAVAAGHLLDIPDELSDVEAALVEPLACCVESLEFCQFAAGESLLIIGGGVMGRLHVALAKALGAGPVALVDRHAERLRHAAALGADVQVAADRSDLDAALSTALAGIGGMREVGRTSGIRGRSGPASDPEGSPGQGERDGFDVIVVTVGQAAAVETAQRYLATAGRLNVFGGLPKTEPELTLDGNTLHYRNQSVLGTTGASMKSLRRAVELLATGSLNTSGLISAKYPLSEALAAFEDAGAVGHARVVLVPG